MSLISKYDDINRNILVLGAAVLEILKKKSASIEEVFQECKKNVNLELNQFLNIVTLLWLLELIVVEGNRLSIKT